MWGRFNVEPISLGRAKMRSVQLRHDGGFSNVNTAVAIPFLDQTSASSSRERFSDDYPRSNRVYVWTFAEPARDTDRISHPQTPSKAVQPSISTFLCIRKSDQRQRQRQRQQARRGSVGCAHPDRDFLGPIPSEAFCGSNFEQRPLSESLLVLFLLQRSPRRPGAKIRELPGRCLLRLSSRYVQYASTGHPLGPNPNEGFQVPGPKMEPPVLATAPLGDLDPNYYELALIVFAPQATTSNIQPSCHQAQIVHIPHITQHRPSQRSTHHGGRCPRYQHCPDEFAQSW